MKKYLYFASLAFATTAAFAQQDLNTAADAVRYASDNITGTARFRAMSGAFGALGGDPSAIMVNPAGSAVFNYNSGTVSLSSYNVSNSANYFGTRTRNNDSTLDLNQIGAIFVFNNSKEGAFMNKFTLGFNYENANNFNNSIYARGVNPNNSVDSYFLRYANGIGTEGGIPLSTLNNAYYEDLNFIDQQAYLGYNAYIINPEEDVPGNTSYLSNVAGNGNYYQSNYVTSTGYNGKIALNFGAQLKERLYVGANVNVHFIDYVVNSSLYEDTNNGNLAGLKELRFDNERYTYGGGVSFNLGAIAKVTEALRLGLAYESPTWLRLQDEITQRLTSFCPQCEEDSSTNTFVVDPGATFIFDDYTIRTPSKWTGSLAYVFGTNGLVSVDYTLKDYSNTEFTNGRYATINTELANTLDAAGELRVGAEYRIKNFSLRGGYRYEQSPYKNGNTVGDLNSFSGGLGYAFGNSRLDLAYAWARRQRDMPMLNAGLTDAYRITGTNNNITLSYTLDL